jgi:hypothetical protein
MIKPSIHSTPSPLPSGKAPSPLGANAWLAPRNPSRPYHGWTWPILLCIGLTGCLSRPALPSASFALNCPAPTTAAPDAANPVLGLKSVTVSPLFEGRSLVYRLADNRYEKDPYAEFLVTPERLVAAAAQAHLRNSGLYREVVEGTSVFKPSQWLEIQVRELYGDFRQPGAPTTVLALKFIVYEPGREIQYQVRVEKLFRRQIALSAPTAAAVVGGWNKALEEIMTELIAELKASARASQPLEHPR